MNDIQRFFHYNKQDILTKTKRKLKKACMQTSDVSASSFSAILADYISYFYSSVNACINALDMRTLRLLLHKPSGTFIKRKVLLEEIRNSIELSQFEELCKEELQKHVDELLEKIDELVENEKARRKQSELLRKQKRENQQWVLHTLEKGNEHIKQTLRQYTAYFVAHTFLNSPEPFLYNDFQSVNDLLKQPNASYGYGTYQDKLYRELFKKWIKAGLADIQLEKGKTFFMGLHGHHPSTYVAFYEWTRDNSMIQSHINGFIETIGKESFKTLFQEGVNRNPKLMSKWKKERVRLLVGK